MTKKKKYCAAVLLAVSMGMISQPVLVSAATTDTPQSTSTAAKDSDNATPAFDNPADALRAANRAEKAAVSNGSLRNALGEVEKAQETMAKTIKSGDQSAMAAARVGLAKAEGHYVSELADISGVSEADIASMRDSGMGWGQVGHELGVHPGVLGSGHSGEKSKHQEGVTTGSNHMGGVDAHEIREATAINMESGWSQGHGVGIQSGVHKSGTGSSRDTGGISGAGGMGHRSDQQDTMGSNNSGHRNDFDNSNDNNNHSGNRGNSNGSGGSSGGGHGGSSGGSSGGGHGGSSGGSSGGGHGGSSGGSSGGGHD